MAGDFPCRNCGGALISSPAQGLCQACLIVLALTEELPASTSDGQGKVELPTFLDDETLSDKAGSRPSHHDRSSPHDDATLPPASVDGHEASTLAPNAGLDVSTEPRFESGGSVGSVGYFGDYELLSEIARGGMGVVYRARQITLNRTVALKMILAGQLAGEDDIKRFHIEAEAAANLDHPGIVPIHEIGEHRGQHFFSMGLVEGFSLAAKVADGPLPPRPAAELTMQVAQAMQYAHEKGVIHRDLKPGNILLDPQGRPKVTDFGLAKKLEGDSGLTHTGQVMGTPSYMPPEQAEGKHVGPLADVYALGAVLYCVLTGRPPFQAASPIDTLLQVVGQDPVPVRQLNPAVPRDLETICLKCLEKDPRRRYASAAELGNDLKRLLEGEPIVARPVKPWERAWKWASRRPMIAGLAASLVVALLVGFSGMALLWARAEENASIARINEEKANLSARTESEARAEAQRNTEVATQKAEDLRRRDYISRVNLAYRECLENNVAHALELLAGCPEDLRGWEYHYVSRQCHLDVQTFREAAPSVNAVAFSPDGQRIATGTGAFQGDSPGDLVVRDVTTGQEVFAHRALASGIHATAYSRDGHSLAVAHGPTLSVYEASTGKKRFEKSTGNLTIDGLAFTPDGQQIVSGSGGEPGYAKIWDATTGDMRGEPINAFEGSLAYVSVSPDGKELAITATGRVEVWDLQTRKPVRTLRGHESFVYAVSYSPDGRWLASAGLDRSICVWDRRTGALVRRLIGHEGFVRGLAFSPESDRIVSCAEDKSVKLWSVHSDRELATFHGHEQYVMSVAFSPDGHLIASGAFDRTAKLWYASPTFQLTVTGATGWVSSVAFSHDGRRIASCESLYATQPSLRVWDPVTGEQIQTYADSPAQMHAIAISPDDRKLAASASGGFVIVWDMVTRQRTLVLPAGNTGVYKPAIIGFSPDGRWLAFGTNGPVIIGDAANGASLHTLQGHTAPVNGVAFSPDGKAIASASSDRTVKLWDTENWKESRTLTGHKLDVSSVAFSPDGRMLASVGGASSLGGDAKLWNVATGQLAFELRGHTDTVSGVAFSPDGRRLATASDDRTIKIWDTATGLETFTLRGHQGGVVCVAFSPDGTRIASGGIDRTAKVWDTGPLTKNALLERTAAPIVADLTKKLSLKAEVTSQIRTQLNLDSSLRAAALKLADQIQEDPNALNNSSWPIVASPNNKPDDYRRSLSFAETACRLAPQEAMFLNTLGVARYRAGTYQDALEVLNRSLKLNSAQNGGPMPADMAFIAMAQYKLGQAKEAQKTFERLRGVMSLARWSFESEAAGFFEEAASLIDPAAAGPAITEVARLHDDTASGTAESAVFSPDGKRILTTHEDGVLRLWDRDSAKMIRQFSHTGGRALVVAFSPDGKRAIAASQDKVLRLLNIDSGEIIRKLEGHSEWIFNVAFSPDGLRAYSTSGGTDPWSPGNDSAVRVWNLETGQQIRKLEGHKGRVFGLAPMSGGKQLLTGGDSSLIVWNAETGQQIRKLTGHRGLIGNVALILEHRAVSGSFDRTIRFWDLETGRETDRFFGHPREVTWVAASADGKLLLSSDYNSQELRFWDVEGRRLIRQIPWGSINPTRGTFSPDGRFAVWAGSDGAARLYRIQTPESGAQPVPPAFPETPNLDQQSKTKK